MTKFFKDIDLFLLSLLILTLPSLEAPKNIFLVAYLIAGIFIQISRARSNIRTWSGWDNIFLLITVTAFFSTIFAGMPNLEEWKGYKVLLTAILTGWLLSRANYSLKKLNLLFILLIISTLPPLLWGFYEYLNLHTKSTLELHSVGHVNHSAIYLVMIFGASLGWFLSALNRNQKKELVTHKLRLFLLAILSFIFFLSLIVGQSRGAFGVAVALGLMLIFLIPKDKKIKIVGALILVSIISLTVFFKAGIVQKQITNQQNNNTLTLRDKVWNVSFEASRFSPLLGIGMSNWHFITLEQLKNSVEKRHAFFEANNYSFPGHSHNLYLTALVERGIVGLIVTFIFMGFWLKQLIINYRSELKSEKSACLWVGSLSAWVATFGIGLVNTTFHHEHAILACIFIGLYASYKNNQAIQNNRY
jgi:O-antigen ligase